MAKPNNFTAAINGQEWRINFVRRGHKRLGETPGVRVYGRCFWHDQQIYVRYDVSEKTMLDTLAHEVMHASSWTLCKDERAVTKAATAVAEVLTLAGYKRRTNK